MTNNLLGLSDYLVWLVGIGIISYSLYKKYSLSVAQAFGWVSLSALMIFQNSFNFLPSDPVLRLYDMFSESALISLLFTVMIVQSFSVITWELIFKALALLNAGEIILHLTIRPHDIPWGILMNGSMSGCFGAALFPLFRRNERWQRWVIAFSVCLTARSLPIAVLASGWFTSLYMRKQWRWALITPPLGMALGFLIKGRDFLNPDGRAFIWLESFHYFKEQVSFLRGAGLGSFYLIGQTLSQGQFTWLHSDWLQIGFETGFIGLVLVAVMYGDALYRLRKLPGLFSALVAFGVFGIANMPLRYPLAGLYGAFLIRSAFDKRVNIY